MWPKPFLTILALGAFLLAPGIAVPAEKTPDPRERFRALLEPYRDLSDYTVQVAVQVRIPGFRVPDVSATVFFRKPDRFRIDTRSFAPIPREGGLFHPLQFDPEKNAVTFQGQETLEGVPAEVFRVEPLAEPARIRHALVWIGGTPRRILQVESHTVRGARARSRPSYTAVAEKGRQWLLPEQVRVHLSFPPGGPSGGDLLGSQDHPFQGAWRLEELPGEGEVIITYTGWKVNRGLKDDVFGPSPERSGLP